MRVKLPRRYHLQENSQAIRQEQSPHRANHRIFVTVIVPVTYISKKGKKRSRGAEVDTISGFCFSVTNYRVASPFRYWVGLGLYRAGSIISGPNIFPTSLNSCYPVTITAIVVVTLPSSEEAVGP
jgi:hypothetical protein